MFPFYGYAQLYRRQDRGRRYGGVDHLSCGTLSNISGAISLRASSRIWLLLNILSPSLYSLLPMQPIFVDFELLFYHQELPLHSLSLRRLREVHRFSGYSISSRLWHRSSSEAQLIKCLAASSFALHVGGYLSVSSIAKYSVMMVLMKIVIFCLWHFPNRGKHDLGLYFFTYGRGIDGKL